MPNADLKFARQAADDFRLKYVTGKSFDKVPLDSVFIADVVLKLDLVAFPGLSEEHKTEAALSHDLKTIYVDEFSYSHYDNPKAALSQKARLRFSVAHEIGHIILHSKLAIDLKAKTFKDLLNAFNSADGLLGGLEKEANEFAGRLIVPIEQLRSDISEYQKIQQDPNWRDSFDKREQFKKFASVKYGIHPAGIDTRLNREELWPSDWVSSANF